MSQRDRDLLFEELVERHIDLVFHVARSWCRDATLAEDLTQTAFLNAYRAFDRFVPGTNFKAWVLRILRNAHLDTLRVSSRSPAMQSLASGQEEGMPEVAAPVPAAIDLQSKEIYYEVFGDEVARLLRELPAEYRLAVILCDVEGLTYAEIADVIGCAVGTVRSRIHRGRARLGRLLRRHAARVGYLEERRP